MLFKKLDIIKYKKVIKYIFSYIHILKNNVNMKYFFEEKKTLAALSYVYSDKGEGATAAIEYANNLSNYPIEISGKVKYDKILLIDS